MDWQSHLFKNFPQFVVIHIVNGFSVVNEAEADVFLDFPCFLYDATDAGNLISGSYAFSKSNLWSQIFFILCVCVCSVMSNSLRPHGLQPARFLCSWDFPGKNTGMDCHYLLHGNSSTQESNPHLLHLLHWEVDAFFVIFSTTVSPGKPLSLYYHFNLHGIFTNILSFLISVIYVLYFFIDSLARGLSILFISSKSQLLSLLIF